jgi:hypothetical protein
MTYSPTETRLELSRLEVIASTLAAASAALVASYFGVNGTVIGAAVASVVATVGSAVYGHWLRRTHDRLRRRRGEPAEPRPYERISRPRLIRWSRVAAASLLVFTAAMGAVTAAELMAHRPLAALIADHPARSATSVGAVIAPREDATVRPTPAKTTGTSRRGRAAPPAPRLLTSPAPSPSASPVPRPLTPTPSASPSPQPVSGSPSPTLTGH